MKFKSNFDKLGFSDFFRFGIELEAYNVNTKGKNSLYGGESAQFIKSKNWHMATAREEYLVSHGGAELVSPILTDNAKDWQTLYEMCAQMKKYPLNKGKEVVADEKCGLHVHFDASYLVKNPEVMRSFLRLYAESEELLYKMCNDVNSPIRPLAINKDFKGIHLISSIWRNGMAAPSGKKILKHIKNNTLKVSFKKFGRLKRFISKYKIDERRYKGLNLTNIGNQNKNTIEFRMANGTLDPNVIKQTVFLYASLIDTAIKTVESPKKYKEQLDAFYKTDVSEMEKVRNFLNLIIENPEDRNIYMNRWKSVKDAPVFAKNYKKGFAQNRFKREEFKNIYERTPEPLIRNAFSYIKGILQKNREEGSLEYGR